MSRNLAAAMAFDMDFLDDASAVTPSSAMVRVRDGRMRSVDVARLAWPDENTAAGVTKWPISTAVARFAVAKSGDT
jgi:hypothetical protein